MIVHLAFRNVVHRPLRSAFLLFGYGLGVGVMIVLLAIGEALLSQARDEKLVGGGEITVLPEGLDVEVMKTGGLGGLFFSIDHARFVYRQLLASPRLALVISAVAPQVEGKLMYLRTTNREYAVRASGEIPSRSQGVGAAAELVTGRWQDDDGDRQWIAPSRSELNAEIDHFHLPPPELPERESWGEWHYFNVLSADGLRWAFISFIVGGDVPDGEWGGQLAISLREQGARTRRYSLVIPSSRVEFSTKRPDVSLGTSRVIALPDGRYHVIGSAPAEDGPGTVDLDLVITPTPGAYFPDVTLASGEFMSGYVVPALRAEASGRICADGRCEAFHSAQAYHDHNWGVWRGVTWEWGAARAGEFNLLYGRVQPPDTLASLPPFFLSLTDSLGFLSLFRPSRIRYDGSRVIKVDDQVVSVPERAVISDVRDDDTLVVELSFEDAIGTDTRRPLLERGDQSAARRLSAPYFIQMKGVARIRGRVGGRVVVGEGGGFFETYR